VDDGGERDTQISRFELCGSIPGCKVSSLLSNGQLPPMLWHWHVGLLPQIKKEKKKTTESLPKLTDN
jgi:hypothetical protein